MTMRLALVAALLVPALAACGGDKAGKEADEPTGPQVPKVGQCFAREVPDGTLDTAPDLESVVPCTEPHVYEVTGVVDIPAKFLDTSSPEASLKRRTALATPGGPGTLSGRAGRAVNCAETWAAMNGVRSMPFKEKVPPKTLVPVISPSSGWLTIAPPALWEAGHHVAICSWRFGGEKPLPVRSTVEGATLLSQAFLPTLPDRLRECLDGDFEAVSCAKPHRLERALQVDVKALLGIDVATLSDVERYKKQGSACGAMVLLAGGDMDDIQPFPFLREDGVTDCYFEPLEDDTDFPAGFQTFR